MKPIDPPRRLLWLCLCAALLLHGCGRVETRPPTTADSDSAPPVPRDVSQVPDAVPRWEPRSKYGNPESYVVNGRRYVVLPSAEGYVERGIASWYGTKFHGRRASNGDTYDMYAMTAAHTTLPLPAYARVTNLQNGRSVVVRINDRGPFHDNRIIDLSYAAATKLDIVRTGTGLVEVRAIVPGQDSAPPLVAAADIAPAGPAQPMEPAPPAPPPKAVQLYLQIGAFISQNNAEQLRQRLTADQVGQVVIREGLNRDQTPIYRVRIGPIASVEEADRLAERLGTLGLGTPHVVID